VGIPAEFVRVIPKDCIFLAEKVAVTPEYIWILPENPGCIP
jgi:hypothetical protein